MADSLRVSQREFRSSRSVPRSKTPPRNVGSALPDRVKKNTRENQTVTLGILSIRRRETRRTSKPPARPGRFNRFEANTPQLTQTKGSIWRSHQLGCCGVFGQRRPNKAHYTAGWQSSAAFEIKQNRLMKTRQQIILFKSGRSLRKLRLMRINFERDFRKVMGRF